MRPKKVRELISDSLEAQFTATNTRQMPPPLYIWGAPGIGKSATPKSIAEELSIGFVDNRPPLRDPTDYRGIPTIIGDTAKWLAPSDLPTEHFCLDCGYPGGILHAHSMEEAADSKVESNGMWTGVKCKSCEAKAKKAGKPYVARVTSRGVLMLDELSSAPPMTQAGCYQLILDRGVGEYHLPNGWFIIAAGNRIEDRAVAYRTSTALLNRFCHVDYEVNIDDWTDWALNAGQIDPNIIGFLKFRGGDLLWKFDPASQDRAFPTPRSWEFASKQLGFIRRRDILSEVLEGTVGKGATAEFISFLKVQTELPDLAPILAGTSKYVPPQNRMDLKYAIVSALVTRAEPKKHYDNLIKYSELLAEEFAVLLVTMMVSRDKNTVATCASFPQWARDHKDVILTKKS
jgi:hypothetical protein